VKARLEPGQDPVNTSGNVVRINSLGFRGEDPAWEAAEGTLRILVLGGSSAFSYDASDDAHTWPSLLESQLADALGKPVEVINLGLPGYDASNSKVNYLFTGRALNPHVVLIYQTWNDLKFLRLVDQEGNGMPREFLSGVNAGGRNLSAFERFFFHSQIVQRVRHVYLRIRNERIENAYTSLEKAGDAANDLPSERAFDQFQKNFEDLALLAKSDGVLPVLVSQATLAQPESLERREVRVSIRNNWVGMTLPVLAQAWLESNRRIEAAAEVGDALFLDGYSAVPPTLENFKDHVHLLDPGAEKLADALSEQLLADPRFRTLAAQVQNPILR
jgi:lysophospholipase L1-like esterase